MFTKIFYFMGKKTKQKTSSSDKKSSKVVEKRGTIGFPFPDTEIKFLDIDTGKEIPLTDMIEGQTGEMLLRGPQRMLGYWPEPGSGLDADGFVHTNDIVRIDKDGYFYIVDRTKDMINVSGYKVYSQEIEEVLLHHPHIEIAAVVGIPDIEREGSERVVVFVQPVKQSHKSITSEEIIEYLKDRVAKYAVPKSVFIIDAIPFTEVYKVNKKLLREMAINDFSANKVYVQ